MTDLWVVKSRRMHGDTEVTSVLSTPTSKETAAVALAELNDRYQGPGNYYIEKWKEHSDDR